MSLSLLFQRCLPINRKEVYYTATVLPGIVCADSFAHIHRFWELLGIEGVPPVDAAPATANIQFLTEFSARHSVYVDLDRARLEVFSGETPDLLILINGSSPVIISIEAKMYNVVSTTQLLRQLDAQRDNVLKPLLGRLLPGALLTQVALVPREMHINAEAFGSKRRLVHWEQIVENFAGVAPASYFCAVLELALENYHSLCSAGPIFHANMEQMMRGEDILTGFGTDAFLFRTMGRSGGRTGSHLAHDFATGGWRQQFYELNSKEEPANANWFAIEEFVAKARQTNLITAS